LVDVGSVQPTNRQSAEKTNKRFILLRCAACGTPKGRCQHVVLITRAVEPTQFLSACGSNPADTGHRGTGDHLHDRAPCFGRTFSLDRHVTSGTAHVVVHAEAPSECAAAEEQQGRECECQFSSLLDDPTAIRREKRIMAGQKADNWSSWPIIFSENNFSRSASATTFTLS
jgi:hypothetical protein